MKISIRADTLGAMRNARDLLSRFKTKKMAFLWRPLANRMARLYAAQFRSHWPGMHPLSPSYLEWKRMRGYSSNMLEATGKLKDQLTKPDGPIVPGTNENALMLGAGNVSSNVTGRGTPRAEMNYPNAVYSGFVAKYPYGFRSNSPRRVVGRNFLWQTGWEAGVEVVARDFAHEMAESAFGSGKVTKL